MSQPELAEVMDQLRRYGNNLWYIGSQIFCTQALHTVPRYQEPKCLVRHGYRVYSQNDEDGIIAEIMRRIGPGQRRCVEFGVGDGLENNTLYLLMQGWQGTWIDCSADDVRGIRDRHAALLESGRLHLEEAFLTAENAVEVFTRLDVPREFDLLSIDIDGNDYWLWRALRAYRPRVVVIEYNAGMGPHAEWKQRYDPQWVWRGTRNFGASLRSLELLGRELGYCLVGCSLKGMNAFFVREDQVRDKFLAPFTAETHFEPPRYFLWYSTGHRKDFAEITSFGLAEANQATLME